MDDKKHIICFSKGHSSAIVAIEVARKYGTENMILVNHDINPEKEDQDIKRFGKEVSDFLGVPITYVNILGISDPEKIPNQFEVCLSKKGFKAPNTSDAFCTYELKTKPFFQWLTTNHSNQNCIVYYGFDANEPARIAKKQAIMLQTGWDVEFPLAHWERTINSTREIGIEPPLAYSVYKHANCKGCLKAGMQHWYVTYCNEYSIFCEAKEAEKILGYTILRKSVNGKLKPFSLEQFEPIFEKMKSAGVPANEHYPNFRKDLKEYGVEEMKKHMPCDCIV